MHGMGRGMGREIGYEMEGAHGYGEISDDRMAEKLKMYKEDLEEEIKFINRRISELEKPQEEKKDE